MRNITNNISDHFVPYKALLIHKSVKQKKEYEQGDTDTQLYVESYDLSKHGNPINAHPLTLKESIALADMLQSSREMQNGYLRSSSILPTNLLYVNPDKNGYAVWFTPAQQKELYFIKTLGIKSGLAYLPSLVWVASREELRIFAVKGSKKPKDNTPLYHPPFFNTYSDGRVCMGTVNIQIDHSTRLEDFIQKWEHYFYESYFSHTLQGGSILCGNIVQLWKKQTETNEKFPDTALVKNGRTIKNLIK